MMLEKTIARLRAAVAGGDRKQFDHAMRDLGHELPRMDTEKLSRFLTGAASARRGCADPYLQGAFETAGNITASFCAEAVDRRNRQYLAETALENGWKPLLEYVRVSGDDALGIDWPGKKEDLLRSMDWFSRQSTAMLEPVFDQMGELDLIEVRRFNGREDRPICLLTISGEETLKRVRQMEQEAAAVLAPHGLKLHEPPGP